MMTIASRNLTIALAVAALLAAALPWWAPAYYVQLASTALVSAMFALSLQVLVGGAGMVSLGHAAFFGAGAYTVMLLPPGQTILATLPAAALLAAACALPVGILSLRTRGFFFLMATLAFGQMLFFVFHDTSLGGGKDGVFVTRPALAFLGWAIDIPRRSRPAAMLWLNLGLLIVVYIGVAALMRTMFGRALQGIKANEDRMRAMGYDTARIKLAAFVLSAALAGIAGHMAAMTEAFVNPDLLGWHRSAEALLMILLGGIGALHGPVIGAFAYIGLNEVASIVTERQRLMEGLVILAVVLVLPRGIAGIAGRR
jgi:branched-chain amino acid transport system permease protein